MRTVILTASFLLVGLNSILGRSAEHKTTKAASPLSADEIQIYKAVLEQFMSKEDAKLQVSAKTYPLEPDSPTSGLSKRDCLQGIKLENIATASHSFHDLPPDVLQKGMTLVDPDKQGKIVHSNDPSRTIRKGKSVENAVKDAFATGLFSMSEIAFDKEHQFAVVSYHFWCGSLCGNGSTLVFEKVNGAWKNAGRNCASWIS